MYVCIYCVCITNCGQLICINEVIVRTYKQYKVKINKFDKNCHVVLLFISYINAQCFTYYVYVHIALYTLYTCSQGLSNYLYYILNYVQIPHNITNAHKNTFFKT